MIFHMQLLVCIEIQTMVHTPKYAVNITTTVVIMIHLIACIAGVAAFSGLETLYSLVVLPNYEEVVCKQQGIQKISHNKHCLSKEQ